MASEMDVLYAPSRWSKRLNTDEVVKKHVEIVTEASQKAKKNVPCMLNQKYGDGPNEKVDIFGTDLPGESEILVYIHGGYWQQLSRDVSSYIVEPLYKSGFKVIVIGYDLCPVVTMPEIVAEIQRAFQYCINYAKLHKSSGISVAGHSAGAHLAASMFNLTKTEDIFRDFYLISGIYNLQPLVGTFVNNALMMSLSTATSLSPQLSNISVCAKVHVIVGEFDSPAFKEQSKKFHEKLQELHVKTEFMMIEKMDHFDIVENLNCSNYELIKLILRQKI